MYAKWAKKENCVYRFVVMHDYLKDQTQLFFKKITLQIPPQRIFQTMLIFFSFGACHIVVLIKLHFFKILDHCANEYALLQTALAPP